MSEMKSGPRKRRVFWWMLGAYALIALAEVFFIVPTVGGDSRSYNGWVPLIALPLSSFLIAGPNVRKISFLFFGLLGSVLLIPWFMNGPPSSLWREDYSVSDETIVITWVVFACLIGGACWLAAHLRIAFDAMPDRGR